MPDFRKMLTMFFCLGFVSAGLVAPLPAVADSTNGLCITDVALKLSKTLGDYRYNSSQNSAKGIRLEVPALQWDVALGRDSAGVAATTMMSMSYHLGDFSSGKCLDAVAVVSGSRGEGAIPVSSTTTQWQARGHWYTAFVRGLNVPSNAELGGYSNAQGESLNDTGGQGVLTGTLVQRQAEYSDVAGKHSQWIVTGLTALRGFYCPPYAAAGYCGGEWYDQQYNFINLMVTVEPYEAFAKNKVASITGRWVELSNCNGCATTSFEYVTGVTKGRTIEKGTETSNSFSVLLGYQANAGTEVAGVSKKIEISYSHESKDIEKITSSFEEQRSTTQTQVCARGRLYQWQTEARLENGEEIVARSKTFVCTANGDSPPAINDFTWTGCDVREVFPAAGVDGGAQPGIRYTSTGSWWECKPKGISVRAASYGSNCGVAKGLVTGPIASQCNGQSSCSYVVMHTVLGDPAPGCPKDYAVEYTCLGGDGTVKTASVAAEAGFGSKVDLACP